MKTLKACFKDEQRLDTAVQALFGLMMAVVIAACLFLSWILYARKQNTLPNLLLLPAGLFSAYAIAWSMKRLMQAVRPERRKMLWIICSLAALALQMVMIHSYYFYTDWDVETIVESAMAAATGSDISRHSNYFSMCPNNLVLVTLLGWIVRFAYFLGLAEHAYFVMLVFLCVICWAAGILLCMLMHHLLHSDVMTAVAWIFYQLLVGISPWISIPYSDSVALIFPVALLSVAFLIPKTGVKGILRMFLMTFLAYFGYRIKPQILIVLMALFLYGAAEWLFGKKIKMRLTAAKFAQGCGLAAGLLCAVLLANSMADDVNVPINKEKTLGITHYLMMGMNPEEFGVFAQRDVSLSWWCETNAERTQKNLQVFAERVQEMGPVGLFKQMMRKTLTNFNDGTFCWAGEGKFYREILEEKNPVLSPLTRSIYYSHEGKLYPVWANFAQMIWMGVLALAACAALGKRDARMSVIMLSLIGLTIFETVFEARARYLFCFAPLFIILAVSGMRQMEQWGKTMRAARIEKEN